jgi:peptide chain release factor subunit 1
MNIENRVSKLLEFKSKEYPITSLYLKLGPKERENFKYRITLKNLIKEQRDRLDKGGFTKQAIESVESDLKKIAGYIENTDQITGCRGIALFSSTGADVWEVFKLPLLYRNRLVVDWSPLVRQLVTISDEFGDIAVVIIDRKKARLFRIGLNGATEVAGYFYPEATRSTKFRSQEGKFKQRVSPAVGGGEVPHGLGEYGFQRKIENEIQQHFRYVSDKLFSYYKENKFDWLVIGGAESVITDFSHHTHTYLKERSLGSFVLEDINSAKSDEIAEKSLELLDSMERRNEARIINEFEEKLHQGFAVNGLESSLKALMMGQVRVLIVAEGFIQSGFICPESGVLVWEKRDSLCPEGKPPVPVVDIVDEAIEEALGQGAEVEVIFDQDAKKKIEGIGAILRFKL